MFSAGLCIITAKCNEIEKEERMDFWEIFQFLKCNVNWELFLGLHRQCRTQCHQYKRVQPRCSLPSDSPRSLPLESWKTSVFLDAKSTEGHRRISADDLPTEVREEKRGEMNIEPFWNQATVMIGSSSQPVFNCHPLAPRMKENYSVFRKHYIFIWWGMMKWFPRPFKWRIQKSAHRVVTNRILFKEPSSPARKWQVCSLKYVLPRIWEKFLKN